MLLSFSFLVSWFPDSFGLLPFFMRMCPESGPDFCSRFANCFVILVAHAHVFENL
jgi:hypothetical protein